MICLSFDTDHVDEARMQEFLAEVPIPGRGTFFCTGPYPCLAETHHELAPHPFLGADNDWAAELATHRGWFPKARGWRAHSCVFSHMLAIDLAGAGYDYVSTHDDFGSPDVRPHRHSWGLWHMPIYYMDNLDFSAVRFWGDRAHRAFDPTLLRTAIDGDGVYVFDFHPIHLMLNSPSADHYFAQRDRYKAGEPIERLRHEGPGVHDFYRALCRGMAAAGQESLSMAEALDRFRASQGL